MYCVNLLGQAVVILATATVISVNESLTTAMEMSHKIFALPIIAPDKTLCVTSVIVEFGEPEWY